MAKPQPEIFDYAQMQIRRHDAAAAMLAVLQDLELLIRVNATLTNGSPAHKTVKAAIAQAERAGIKAEE